MKTVIFRAWASVMDSDHNPLRGMDLASRHYLMQVLGWMWSMVFSLSFLSIFQFHYVWLAHVLLVAGVFGTWAVFRLAPRAVPVKAKTAAPRETRCVWKLDSEA